MEEETTPPVALGAVVFGVTLALCVVGSVVSLVIGLVSVPGFGV
jgi:hypothetical protein